MRDILTFHLNYTSNRHWPEVVFKQGEVDLLAGLSVKEVTIKLHESVEDFQEVFLTHINNNFTAIRELSHFGGLDVDIDLCNLEIEGVNQGKGHLYMQVNEDGSTSGYRFIDREMNADLLKGLALKDYVLVVNASNIPTINFSLVHIPEPQLLQDPFEGFLDYSETYATNQALPEPVIGVSRLSEAVSKAMNGAVAVSDTNGWSWVQPDKLNCGLEIGDVLMILARMRAYRESEQPGFVVEQLERHNAHNVNYPDRQITVLTEQEANEMLEAIKTAEEEMKVGIFLNMVAIQRPILTPQAYKVGIGEVAAIIAFMGWLTSREQQSGPFGKRLDAGEGMKLVGKFCKSQGWEIASNLESSWHSQLKEFPKD